MRGTPCDTSIDAPRTPEILDVDPSDEPPKTVADEIDAATADVPAQVVAQTQCGLLDPGTGPVVERKDLFGTTKTKVCSYRE